MDNYFNSETYYKRLSTAVLLPYLLLTIQAISSKLIGLGLAQMVSKVVVGLYFAYVFVKYFNRLCPAMISSVVFFSFIFIIDSLIHINKTTDRFDVYIYFISTCLPIFVYARKIKKWDVFLECSRRISYIIIGLGMFILITRNMTALGQNEYNMSLGYHLLFPTICMLYFFLINVNALVHAIFFVMGTIVILFVGSRGPVLGIVLFWGLYKLFVSRVKSWKELIYTGIEIAFLLILYFNFNAIVSQISSIMEFVGLESRTLQYLLEGNIGNLSNRDIIYDWAFEQIGQTFFLGNGIGYSLATRGTYCHNIIVEMAVEFGVFITFGIILFLIILSAYKLFTSNSLEKRMILIWFCVGVIPLFMSFLYWEFMQFWTFLGVVISSGNEIELKIR